MEEKIKRALYMLMVANNLLTKQKDSHYVLNMLEETIDYDGAECDGDCILDDIEYCLADFGIFPDEDASYIDYSIFNIPKSCTEVKIDEEEL